jgi:hypothetical protein
MRHDASQDLPDLLGVGGRLPRSTAQARGRERSAWWRERSPEAARPGRPRTQPGRRSGAPAGIGDPAQRVRALTAVTEVLARRMVG